MPFSHLPVSARCMYTNCSQATKPLFGPRLLYHLCRPATTTRVCCVCMLSVSRERVTLCLLATYDPSPSHSSVVPPLSTPSSLCSSQIHDADGSLPAYTHLVRQISGTGASDDDVARSGSSRMKDAFALNVERGPTPPPPIYRDQDRQMYKYRDKTPLPRRRNRSVQADGCAVLSSPVARPPIL